MMNSNVISEITTKYPQIEISEAGHVQVPVEIIEDVMYSLKNDYGFNFLTNVTAVDFQSHFQVVYDLCVIGSPDMLHIMVKIDRENPQIPSMVPIWGGGIWQERETYDLLGIVFKGHPDLRRILLQDDFEGYPLRRDFQWEGGRE